MDNLAKYYDVDTSTISHCIQIVADKHNLDFDEVLEIVKERHAIQIKKSNLPTDILREVFVNTAPEDVENFCKATKSVDVCDKETLQKKFYRDYGINLPLKQSTLKNYAKMSDTKYHDKFLYALNELALYYHGYFGFEGNQYRPEENINDVIKSAKFGADVFYKDKKITVEKLKGWKGKHEKFDVEYPVSVLKSKAKMIVPYRIIVLMFPPDYWAYGKPSRKWYNELIRPVPKNKEPLPFLNTRPYIVVDDPFMKVTVSSVIKGELLTIDDILFAARALCTDGWRNVRILYNPYKIIDDKLGFTLILEPSIDNFST